MSFKQFWNKKRVAVLFATLLVIVAVTVFYKWKLLLIPKQDVTMAKVDLDSLLKEHPDWSKYEELQKEMDQLRKKWGIKSSNSQAEAGKTIRSSGISELNRQVSEIEQSYYDETKLKQDNLNKTVQEYVQNQTQQLNTLLGDKFKSINTRLSQDLRKKSKEIENKYQAYVNEIQNENKVKLSNLQLQLSTLDLTSNQITAKSERERIQAEIERLQKEMEQKKAAKYNLLQKDTELYADNRKKEAIAEFEEFKAENEQKYEADIMDFRNTMEEEYLTWQKEREREKNSAKKLREDQRLEEYRKDSAKETILKSQQAQLKEAMVWEIRQKAKTIAQARKIDCILVGEIINIHLVDMTRDVAMVMLK
jgi:Skp family chaperone for outer membrane proteins